MLYAWLHCGWHGYRSDNRYVVFQALPHTLGLEATIWRILAKCHGRRNIAEYAGHLEVDERLLEDLVGCAENVFTALKKPGPATGITPES